MIVQSKLRKYFLIIFSIIILSLLVFLPAKIYSDWKIRNTGSSFEESEDKIIKIFKENKAAFDSLVEKMYSSDEEICIYFSGDSIDFRVNYKKVEVDEEYYNLLKRFHNIIKCDSIHLYKSSTGYKNLKICINSGGAYEESIVFCKDKNKEFEGEDEICPGWYYVFFGYV